jgi:hypothetical protein
MYLMQRLTSFLHTLRRKKRFLFSDKPSMHQILHCCGHCSLLCPSLDSVPKFALVNARNYQHHFSCWRFRSGLFLTGDVSIQNSDVYSPAPQITVSILCWKSSIDFCPQNSNHGTLFFFGAYAKGAAMLITLRHNWPFKVETAPQWRRESMLLAALTVSSADNTTK